MFQYFRKKPESGYLVAVDTESHDYPKFIIRSLVLAATLSYPIEENVDKIINSAARTLSGSHIAGRMEIVAAMEKLFSGEINVELSEEQNTEAILDNDQKIVGKHTARVAENVTNRSPMPEQKGA